MEKLTIVDLDGKAVEVTGLALAVMQADDFRHYRVAQPTGYQLYLYRYWEDMYQKLCTLRNCQAGHNQNGTP